MVKLRYDGSDKAFVTNGERTSVSKGLSVPSMGRVTCLQTFVLRIPVTSQCFSFQLESIIIIMSFFPAY